MTAGHGKPSCRSVADNVATSASTEPTERSMPPVVMTKVIAAATISSGADCRRMFKRLGDVRKAAVATEKMMQTTTKNSAIDTTLPLASIASRHVPFRTLRDWAEWDEVASLMPTLHRDIGWRRSGR